MKIKQFVQDKLVNIICIIIVFIILSLSLEFKRGILVDPILFFIFSLIFGIGMTYKKENYEFINITKNRKQQLIMVFIIFSNFFLPLSATNPMEITVNIYLSIFIHFLFLGIVFGNLIVALIKKKQKKLDERLFKDNKKYWIIFIIYAVVTLITFFVGLVIRM